jgi:thioesterase domain-containing protein
VDPVASERYVVVHRRGKKPPLFWVQPGMVQTPVVQEIDRDQPVYFLYRLQPDPSQRPLRFDEIAAYHVETLRSLFPQGPYALAGYCVCSTIAYEMASQLRAKGETVSALIMIDPVDPAITRGALVQEPPLFRLGFNFHRVLYHLQKIKRYSTRDKLAYCRKRLKVIQGRLKSSVDRRLSNTRQHTDSPMAQSAVDVHASDMYGFTNCVPQPYEGSAVLLRPSISPRNAYRYPNLRWAQLITGGLEFQEVPGDSDNMWVAPNAKGMAKIIESCLARIQSVPQPGLAQTID